MNVFVGDLKSIDFNNLINKLKSSSLNVGCVLLFIGFVRSEGANGGIVKNLFYEAYEDLAKKELEKIVSDVMQINGIFSVEVMHMLGLANPGDCTFIVGVASKHRSEGFKVLREIVERVKSEVHIWKKEITDKGEYWVSSKSSSS
ncbi:MAG: molybdenum cofactor biosynthesis protein MoaE [Candidatus Methanomethylicia archaeon]|nr:molybdenum cofactor biosynthesis protein MoaE [Candidatus Methanomethylicia archaeon]MCX8168835.1 molybdenum cofactor biosynthesis protein MoaE [Candidatus Methanomethylicia archaeon]MDW7988567.1 molybdenum cofactor biosynthesis protein MoaE [Nitrososphaerota archaeon]